MLCDVDHPDDDDDKKHDEEVSVCMCLCACAAVCWKGLLVVELETSLSSDISCENAISHTFKSIWNNDKVFHETVGEKVNSFRNNI